jgi:D-isomer specific 2-hydroxyacid dehydrogenase-like protein
MPHPQSSPLEVTRALLDCAKAASFDFGDDTAIVTVQHMLQQTVDLFKTVSDIGLSLENIFALGKVYSNSSPVIEALRDMGITVIDSTMPAPGEFDSTFARDTQRLWQIAAGTLAERRIKRVLVLDDGGVCITSVPPAVLRRYAVCGVEQTSLGTFLFEEKPPPFAVVSWARSAVKLEIGGPIFSQCFIDRLHTEFLGTHVLNGKQLGIIGMGSIGRGVANLAAAEGKQVLYYDPNPCLPIPPALRDKITRLHSLEELMLHCDYVMGCSGRNPFKNKWPLEHKPGVTLLSVSGGDQEFGPIIRDLRQKPGFSVIQDTWNVTSANGPSGPIEIAYLGYPYNFVSRAPEAVPTRIVQLETGGLLAALVQARTYLDLCEANLAVNRGMHRVAPSTQRFVYQRWLETMRDRNIDIIDLFRYDRTLLDATQNDVWFAQNSEPHPSADYTPLRILEEKMDVFVCEECMSGVRLKRKDEANLSATAALRVDLDYTAGRMGPLLHAHESESGGAGGAVSQAV